MTKTPSLEEIEAAEDRLIQLSRQVIKRYLNLHPEILMELNSAKAKGTTGEKAAT
jgi:hypothetical protein